MNTFARATVGAAYIATVVLANVLTEHLGLVAIGFGLAATAGTFAAGATLIFRNIDQDLIGPWLVVGLMFIGFAVSWWLASPVLAVASAAAFALSESADMAIYWPLRKHGFARAALPACTVGAIVDTFAFLHLAGFRVTTDTVAGQLLVKIGVSGLAIAIVGVGRAVLRQPVNRAGA